MLKTVLKIAGALIVVAGLGAGAFAWTKIAAFDASMAKKYDVPLPNIERSTDPVVLERGKHLAESIGGCSACHGLDYASGRKEEMGPIGTFRAPNLTAGKNGILASYSDGELARLIKHGIRKDGTSVRFMPSGDFSWWPEADVAAVISFLRTLPPVDGEPSIVDLGPMAKILDQMNMMPIDTARRIDHDHLPKGPTPAPTKEYGAFVAKLCQGCHGEHLSGGPIPGAPPSLPVPLNLTPHSSGLEGWTFEDFDKLMRQGIRRNGAKLNPFMPIETLKNFSEVEMKALWAYLQTLPPMEFGKR